MEHDRCSRYRVSENVSFCFILEISYLNCCLKGNESTVQTVSTPISRHPAEDTLDYTYDNVALQMTPGDKPKTETTF